MKLEHLSIKGFRSYTDEQTLDVAEVPPGLYLVSGVNGAGKSTIFDALHWTLFGETSRGLRAGTVSNWTTQKKCECRVTFDGTEISRGWSPNYLRVAGEEVDQQRLETVLRLTPEIALSTFYFSQFADFFLDLKPSQRMEIYSTVLGLDLWEDKADTSRKLATEYSKEAQITEVQEGRARERYQTLLRMDYTAEIEQWEKERQGKLDAIEVLLNKAKEQVKALGLKVAKQRTELTGKTTKVSEAQETVAVQRKSREQAVLTASTARAAARQASLQLASLVEQKRRFETLGVGECPTCKQEIGKLHRTKHLVRFNRDVAEGTNAEEKAHQLAEMLEAAVAKIQVDEELVLKAQREFNTADVELRSRIREQTAEEMDVGRREAEKKNVLAAINLFAAKMQRSQQEAAEALAEADKLFASLVATRKLITSFEFWSKGFKDVRFQVIQESLTQLNAEVNECLHDLGLVGWELRFDVERETKKGTVKRGFLCTVLSPQSPEGVPWEAWSGGESQRLRVAAQLGVSNLISSRLGLSPDFEFWDEPTVFLNDEGIKDMMGVLQERAQRYQRRIFLADHRVLDFEFDGELHVEKTDTGSQLGKVEM